MRLLNKLNTVPVFFLCLTSIAAAQQVSAPAQPSSAPALSTDPVAAPAPCDPPCRSGFTCRDGVCASLCNPPCGPLERCVEGECEVLTAHQEYPDPRQSYLSVEGLFRAKLNSSAQNQGEIRVEFGGHYSTFEIGPVFGEKLMGLRSALQGHVPFQPWPERPLFIVPGIALGYTYSWLDDAYNTALQDIFVAPSVRLWYAIIPRLVVIVDLLQVEVNFIRLSSSSLYSTQREKVVPTTWNFGLGLAFFY